ncbi:MAG: hypothetical protein JXB88_07990 [Spirochaetales bacterium]|nr:hypothetical protein [Spirochaetales bacterium]
MMITKKKNSPVIYEINTRVWIKRFSQNGKSVSLKHIPDNYWEKLAEMGIDFIWLMGIWQTNKESTGTYCFTRDLVGEYSRSLPDWKEEDVIGSPYAIDIYNVHSTLGTNEDIMSIKEKLNTLGMKLILDFVPNHFSAFTRLLYELPELFIIGDEEARIQTPHVFFSRDDHDYIFAHGRDPNFDPWQDTVQVNSFHEKARCFLKDTLLDLTLLCDGVRCDMAMLLLNDIFFNTWKHILLKRGFKKPDMEFWDSIICQVRKRCKDFIFIAEAYWDTGWRLQQLGFDYTYDKELYDRLVNGSAHYIQSHLLAEQDYQKKSMRFIENHDEARAACLFGTEKSRAAALVINTIQGLCFLHDGQCEGKEKRLPVQLGREGEESVKREFIEFYRNLLEIRKSRIIQSGTWELIWPVQAWEGNSTYKNFLAWMWTHRDTHLLVVINYSDSRSQCRLLPVHSGTAPFIIFNDLSGSVSYKIETVDLIDNGLYIELEKYRSHILYFQTG